MKDKTGRGDDTSRPRKADKHDEPDVTADAGELPPIVVKRPPRLRSKRSDGDDDRRG
ncbi:hypothetical protein NOCA1240113 [metagenome]|uniref:Uncharacterized protein n=1 Tax=metagenome TaxID=256318 RepID=A0A2P2CG86_9ZZZZ